MSVSWAKVILHGLGVAVAFFLPAVLLSMVGAVDGYGAGEFSAPLGFFGLLLGFAWSFGHQSRQPFLAHSALFFLLLLFSYEIFVLGSAAVRRREPPKPTGEEAAAPIPYVAAGSAGLCQDAFGLRLQTGDLKLEPAPEFARVLLEKAPNEPVVYWAYRAPSGEIVALMAAKGFRSEASLKNYLRGHTRAAEERPGVSVTQQEVAWSNGHGTVLVKLQQEGGAKMATRCLSSPDGKLACVQTIGSEDSLQTLREGLSLERCP